MNINDNKTMKLQIIFYVVTVLNYLNSKYAKLNIIGITVNY